MIALAKSLYVGNLPWGTNDEDLAALFSEYVQVLSCRIVTDRETGRSRGFGFVEVPDTEVEKAIATLNGTLLGGRALTVNEARAR